MDLLDARGLSEYLEGARGDAERLVAVAGKAGLGAAVATCPGWDVGDLVRHLVTLSRGLLAFLEGGGRSAPTEEDWRAWSVAPGDGELLDVYLGVRRDVEGAFLGADPGMEIFTFLPAASPLLFWARRDAHETAIHRADVELAAGVEIMPFSRSFAAEGIAELLGFVTSVGSLVGDRVGTLRFLGDTDVWTVRISPEGSEVVPDVHDADCVVEESTHDLYLALWNRRDFGGLRVTGDTRLLDTWRAKARWEI